MTEKQGKQNTDIEYRINKTGAAENECINMVNKTKKLKQRE